MSPKQKAPGAGSTADEYVVVMYDAQRRLMLDAHHNVHGENPWRHTGDVTQRTCENRGCEPIYRRVATDE